jgi:hypothetical protein
MLFLSTVTQLVKSTKDNTKLDMLVLDEEKKKKQTKFTLVFVSVHVRETFCQQIMQMKNMHSSVVDVDQISVFVGTWNMGNDYVLVLDLLIKNTYVKWEIFSIIWKQHKDW